jgi:hypothetical protein
MRPARCQLAPETRTAPPRWAKALPKWGACYRELPRIRVRRTSWNSVKAKFGIASLQTTQDHQRGSKKRGGPVKWEKEETEDRPNAVTLITLRLPIEMRLCQVAIIIYTRWPFLTIAAQPYSEGPTLGEP